MWRGLLTTPLPVRSVDVPLTPIVWRRVEINRETFGRVGEFDNGRLIAVEALL